MVILGGWVFLMSEAPLYLDVAPREPRPARRARTYRGNSHIRNSPAP
jgi:hypothetical protein